MAEPMNSQVRSTPYRKKILVVDDSPDAAELVRALLELQGHEVRSAFMPREAIAIAQEFQPDVAFLDIGLPDMDGFELAATLSTLPELRDCRFIAITGYDDADDRRKSKQVGFEAHLVKPISAESLERAVLGARGRSAQQVG
ncbi:MAG TPA: response regulator [Polyangiaceae bacterium]|jgi:CheY-like chemotaxis protein|nr:response regulator [Polyangiaceae bacterium]